MKQELEYYYGLVDIEVHYKDKEYIIYKGHDKYIFKPCYRNYDELVEIYKLLDNNYNLLFSRIMINRDNRLVTVINNTSYILLKIQVDDIRLIDFSDLLEFNNKNIIYEGLDLKKIYRTNWIDLWSRKLDYFEYQMIHIKDKYKFHNLFPVLASACRLFHKQTMRLRPHIPLHFLTFPSNKPEKSLVFRNTIHSAFSHYCHKTLQPQIPVPAIAYMPVLLL